VPSPLPGRSTPTPRGGGSGGGSGSGAARPFAALRVLRLSDNYLDAASIPWGALGQMESLQMLCLERNRIEGLGPPACAPVEMGTFPVLEVGGQGRVGQEYNCFALPCGCVRGAWLLLCTGFVTAHVLV